MSEVLAMNKIKQSIDDLAIFTRTPAFEEKLHVGRPNIGNRQVLRDRFEDMLERRWFTNNGPYVQQLESEISSLLGVKHCIAMCNGTVAMEIAIRAAGLRGEVIVPSFTFVATAHALQWQEITPVFCDIEAETHSIDPSRVEQMITPRTTGIIGVHLWGKPCNIEALEKISRENNLKLLFDAAHAFGCTYKGSMIGNFGEAEVFSFHATKFFNTFEGGAIATNNDDLAQKARLMKNFGFVGYDNVMYLGTNGKMSEVSALMGLTNLESINEFTEANYRNYKIYREQLKDIPGVDLITYDEEEKSNYQYVIIEIDEKLTQTNRDDLLAILWAENIIARSYFYPGCHRMEPYRSYFPHAGLLLPNTIDISARVVGLPTGTAIEHNDIEAICQIIRIVLNNGGQVKTMMANASKKIR
jgi:dTDP-4-amino-4,6-dideoxygalactose transaminase